jgi:hypothetical protein
MRCARALIRPFSNEIECLNNWPRLGTTHALVFGLGFPEFWLCSGFGRGVVADHADGIPSTISSLAVCVFSHHLAPVVRRIRNSPFGGISPANCGSERSRLMECSKGFFDPIF